MPPSAPPSLIKIYLRAVLGALTKRRSLGSDVTRLPDIPKENLIFSIDPRHVQEFVNVVNRGDPPSSHGAPDTIPVTYLQCLLNAMPMKMLTHRKFPLDIIGSVHESFKVESWKALSISDSEELRASCYLLPEITRSDKNDLLFQVRTKIETEHGGERIMDITNEYRVLNPQRQTMKVSLQSNKSTAEVPINYFDERTWQLLSTWNFPIDTGRAYAALNGDINPIHLFPVTAMLFGYKSCIAHGMYSVCKLVNEKRFADLTTSKGPCTVTARFTRPTMLPNSEVMTFLKRGENEYVIGTKNKDGQFKETVKGTISLHN